MDERIRKSMITMALFIKIRIKLVIIIMDKEDIDDYFA